MKLVSKIKALRLELLRRMFGLLPIEKNKLLFSSFGFNAYSCNPKYIALELEKRYPGQYDIVWVFDVSVQVPEDFPHRYVRYFSVEYMKEIATAGMILSNTRLDEKRFYFKKRKGQRYLQTWHGSYGPKRIEADAEAFLDAEYVAMAKRDSKICDMMLSSCDKFAQFCRTGCWYDGPVLVTGMPRCDIFFDPDTRRKIAIREKLGLGQAEKLVLYAPTFRAGMTDPQNPRFPGLCDALEKRFGGKWTAIRSIHPNLRHSGVQEQPGCRLLPDNADAQELLHISDAVVTDYSSTMIDAAIAGKPVFLFTPDLEHYRADERGFYYDIGQTPFPLCCDDGALEQAVAGFDQENYALGVQKYLTWMGCKEDGHCAARAAEWIKEVTG